MVSLLNRYSGESPHMISTVQASSPKVAALIYDTAEHAKQRLNLRPSGVPLHSQTSGQMIGRLYRISNVILEVDQAAGIPRVSAAAHDLAREAPSR